MSCPRHRIDLSVFCLTDQAAVCVHCAAMEHRGHSLGLVAEERRKEQEKLKNQLIRSKAIHHKQKKRVRLRKRMVKQIQEEAKAADDFCEGVLVGVIDTLQRQYRSVRRRIRAREEAKIAEVDASIQRLQLSMEERRSRQAELDRLLQTESDVDFLQKCTSLQSHAEPDPNFGPEHDPALLFMEIRRTLEEVGKQLQELCARELGPISLLDVRESEPIEETDEDEDDPQMDSDSSDDEASSGFTGLREPAKPVTRADFLRYAHKLTFDSATAHQDLLVSSDEREVRLCSQTVIGPSSRSPHRFIHRKQLLCREPLVARWSYYEVELEGSKAEIGLAYWAMDRKSRTSLSAFGGNAHSWSLDRSACYSVSHKDLSVQLTSAPCHPRIGVFVKYSEGVVSFYEVGETMIVLYELRADFTAPLYPGFWLGEKCRISICDLV